MSDFIFSDAKNLLSEPLTPEHIYLLASSFSLIYKSVFKAISNDKIVIVKSQHY